MGTLFKRTDNGKPAKRWTGEYRDGSNKLRRKALSTDKGVSQRMLADLERQADKERAGMIDRYSVHFSRPLSDHLKEYLDHLRRKDDSDDHVGCQSHRITSIIDAGGWKRIGDIEPTDAQKYLKGRREDGLAKTTSNHYITAVKGFTRWLWTDRRSPDDALVGLTRQSVEDDLRRPRRALSADELTDLLRATRTNAKPRWGLSANDRYHLYLMASMTGLRAKELSGLTLREFDFASKTPTVKVVATLSKNRKFIKLPLHPELAKVIQAYIADRPEDQRIWQGEDWARKKRGAAMLRYDLKAAKIPYETHDGQFDFHALRVQFITSMALADVHPKLAQELARHSTPHLTFQVYAKINMAKDLAPALDKLTLPKV